VLPRQRVEELDDEVVFPAHDDEAFSGAPEKVVAAVEIREAHVDGPAGGDVQEGSPVVVDVEGPREHDPPPRVPARHALHTARKRT
jgi:hypothetical protein